MTAMTLCVACGAPAADLPMPYQRGAGTLCPQCAARVALEEAAGVHLHALIYPTVLAWARHWAAAGVSADGLSTTLSLEGFHWHPDGALYRGPVNAHASAAAVICEALAPAENQA